AVVGVVDRRAVEDIEPRRGRAVGLGARQVLRGQAEQGRRHDTQCRLVLLADDEEVAAALRPKYGGRWILDRHRLAQPGLERLARGAAGGLSASGVAHTGGQAASGTEFFLQYALEEMVLAEIRRGVAFEDDLR